MQSLSPTSNFFPKWIFCSHQASFQTLLVMPCSFSVFNLAHICLFFQGSTLISFLLSFTPPTSHLCETLHYPGIFGLVLTFLVSTTAISPSFLFYSFLWLMYSNIVSTITIILCIFHITHGAYFSGRYIAASACS